MTTPVVAIVHLGRSTGMGGGRRRVESWCQLFRAAGAEPVGVSLLRDHRATVPGSRPADLLDLAQGRIVPEALTWSLPTARRNLEKLRPDIVVLITARAYRPAIAESAPTVVLDYVDRLSLSYQQRTLIAPSQARRLGYRSLTPFHRRFESRGPAVGVLKVAAGWEDALALGADWVPITTETSSRAGSAAVDHDILFVGTLSYPPNIDALERLSTLWPEVLQRRPGTTALIAGAAPSPRVEALVRECGWTLAADFASLDDVLDRARVAVAPIVHAAGIQIKVLDAAAHGLPQVVMPAALAGLRPGFPATVARDDAAFVAALLELLTDRARGDREGSEARSHIHANYSAASWLPWAADLIRKTRK